MSYELVYFVVAMGGGAAMVSGAIFGEVGAILLGAFVLILTLMVAAPNGRQ